MSLPVKLDIISDIVCPWCIVGYKRLEAAINELGVQDKVEIEWQPFELNPDMPPEGQNLREHLAKKYGTTGNGSARARREITEQGAEQGFEFNYFDEMKVVSTTDAHILLDFALQHGKQTALKLRLFTAFFTEQKDISDRTLLMAEVEGLGLNVDEAMAFLNDEKHRDQVRQQEEYWRQLGVASVPTVVINRTSGISGAHSVDTYKQVLVELLEKEGVF